MVDKKLSDLTAAGSVSDTDMLLITSNGNSLRATRSQVIAPALRMQNNLGDLGNAPTARVNLGLGSVATHDASEFVRSVAASVGTVLAGPASGPSALPTYRTLVSSDIPALDASSITTGTLSAARLPVVVGAGPGHAAGAVPDPGLTSGLGRFLRDDGTWAIPGGSSTVNTLSISTANGFGGSVSTANSTASIALTTTVSGLLKGNGSAVSPAVAGTDYLAPSNLLDPVTSAVAIAHGGTGATTAAAALLALGSASDSSVVHKAGAETITGAKTVDVHGAQYTAIDSAYNTTVPFTSQSTGTMFNGVVDNTTSWGYQTKVSGQPMFCENLELRFVQNPGVVDQVERYNSFTSIDGSLYYRPQQMIVNLLNNQWQEIKQSVSNITWVGYGVGFADPSPPELIWNGVTGNLSLTGSSSYFSGNYVGGTLSITSTATLAWATVTNALTVGSIVSPLTVTDGTTPVVIGTRASVTGAWIGVATPSATNYVIQSNGSTTQVNAPASGGNVSIRCGNTVAATISATGVTTIDQQGKGLNCGSSINAGTSITCNTTDNYPVYIGGVPGSTSQPGVWINQATPSTSNHALRSDGNNTYVNAVYGANNAVYITLNGSQTAYFGWGKGTKIDIPAQGTTFGGAINMVAPLNFTPASASTYVRQLASYSADVPTWNECLDVSFANPDSTHDGVHSCGFNVSPGGGKVNPSTHCFRDGWEYRYSSGNGVYQCERHVGAVTLASTTSELRPITFIVNLANGAVSGFLDLGYANGSSWAVGLNGSPVVQFSTSGINVLGQSVTLSNSGVTTLQLHASGYVTFGAANASQLSESGLVFAGSTGGGNVQFGNGIAGGGGGVYWKGPSTNYWAIYQNNGDTNLYVRDQTNARMHVTYSPGASATAAVTEINSSLKVDGNMGFYGTSPVAKPTVSGSRSGNAALASLLSALAGLGLIVDSTSA